MCIPIYLYSFLQECSSLIGRMFLKNEILYVFCIFNVLEPFFVNFIVFIKKNALLYVRKNIVDADTKCECGTLFVLKNMQSSNSMFRCFNQKCGLARPGLR